ncbi:tetratricopeptide repeat protein [Caulobacter endophyticus]|nr:tetratricopeptide repeat protein [Caulobacter endophyticus]
MKFAALFAAGALLAAAPVARAQEPTPGAQYIAAAQEAAKAGNKDEAFRQMELAAKAGNVLVAYFLGRAYEQGGDVPQDETKALAYYSQAAKGGHMDAEYRLGMRHLKGEGLPRDREKAIDYLVSADRHGSMQADAELRTIAQAEDQKLSCAKDAVARLGYERARTTTAMFADANEFVRSTGRGGDFVSVYGPTDGSLLPTSRYRAVRLLVEGYRTVREQKVSGGSSSVTFYEYEDRGDPSAQGAKDAEFVRKACGL